MKINIRDFNRGFINQNFIINGLSWNSNEMDLISLADLFDCIFQIDLVKTICTEKIDWWLRHV